MQKHLYIIINGLVTFLHIYLTHRNILGNYQNWIQGIITFIFKSKDKYDINNYRPITITTIIYKIWDTSMKTG